MTQLNAIARLEVAIHNLRMGSATKWEVYGAVRTCKRLGIRRVAIKRTILKELSK